MVDNIEIKLNCVLPNKETLSEILNSMQSLNLDWTEIFLWNIFSDEESKKHQIFEEAVTEFIDNIKGKDSSLYCENKNDNIHIYKLLVQNSVEEGLCVNFVSKEPNFTIDKFHYYEQFFYNIYQSLEHKVSYKSFVGVDGQRKFARENDLLKYKYISAAFLNAAFFYRCLTPASVYKEWHTKEQLFAAPFYSIKELDNEILEIIALKDPFSPTSEVLIEQYRTLIKYLSENNTYPEKYRRK